MEHYKNVYIVQGLFYMDRQTYGIGQKPGIGEAVYLTNDLFHTLFSGVIAQEPYHQMGPLYGALQDQFGISNLTDVELSDDVFTFTKQYEKRKDTIQYSFEKKLGQLWIGTLEGAVAGSGFAKCLITSVKKDFFEPYSTAEALGITLK